MSGHDDGQVRLIAVLKATPAGADELRQTLAAMVPSVLGEAGCLEYAMHVERDAPTTVVMYERWQDQSAFDAHVATAGFQALADRFDELLAEPLAITFLTRVA